jgi:hypothetical protein
VLTKSVDSYDTDTAIVTLIHSTQRVKVDVSLVVDDLRFTQGEWLNVIGYLEEEYELPFIVKGMMVWGVSPGFDLLAYEDSVAKRMEATL